MTSGDSGSPCPPVLLELISGHTNAIRDLAYSPDGHLLATSSDDGTVKLWDVATGELRHTLMTERARLDMPLNPAACGQPHPDAAILAFRPDGKTLITSVPWGGDTYVWDVETGERLAEIYVCGEWAAFSPDGTLAASAHFLGVFDTATGRRLWEMDEPIDVMGEPGLVFSADGSLLVARCHSKIVILDSRTGEVRRVLWTSRTGGSRSTVAVSPDGSKIAAMREATSSDMDRLFVWDANTGELLVWAPVEYPLGISIRTLLFTPDGSALLGVCCNMVAILDPETGALRSVSSPVEGRANKRNTCDIQTAVLSPDGNTLACASYEGVVRLHDPRTNAWTGAIGKTGGRPPQIHVIALSPDGSTLASGSKDGAIRLWDTKTGRLRDTRRLHGGGIWRLAYSPNGRMLASSGAKQPLRLWDPQSLELIEEPEMPDARSRPIAFSPGGALLATSAGELTREENTAALIVINLRTGDRCELPCLEDESAPSSIAFSPDGTLLATTSNGRAAVRSAHTGKVLLRSDGRGWYSGPTFSPCGRYLVVSNWDSLVVADLRAERLERRLIDLHGTFPMSEAFSPDGRWLLVGLSDNGSVALYEVPAWREHVRLYGHSDGVQSVAWSPDGQRVYSGSDDGTIKVWDPWTPRLLATLAVLPPRHEGAPEDEWVSYTPHGPFACSKNAHQYIQWRQEDELLPYPARADRRLTDLSGWLMA